MAYLVAALMIDAPASALNNAGQQAGTLAENAIVVKKIRTPEGEYPYVSAQAFRYWVRTYLETSCPDWRAAPVYRERKVAYTDANPIRWWDDDLFGYMRAPSQKADAGNVPGATELEKGREVTRISPFRVGTFVSVTPVEITRDFGTMARQEGDPVPYEHEFYRAHLWGPLLIDLSAAGTFFDGERVGFKNLDHFRREEAEQQGLAQVTVRKQKAFRLPIEQRMQRVATLVRALAELNGGAKLTLHYTDVTPQVLFAAISRHGNNPFYRMFSGSRTRATQFQQEAFQQVLKVYEGSLLSQVYVGWATGFLDEERAKLEAAIKEGGFENRVLVGHPAEQLKTLAERLSDPANSSWYD